MPSIRSRSRSSLRIRFVEFIGDVRSHVRRRGAADHSWGGTRLRFGGYRRVREQISPAVRESDEPFYSSTVLDYLAQKHLIINILVVSL